VIHVSVLWFDFGLAIQGSIARGDFDETGSLTELKKSVHLKQFEIDVGQLTVNVDDKLIKKVVAFAQDLGNDLREISQATGDVQSKELESLDMDKIFALLLNSLTSQKISFGKLKVNHVEVILTLHAAPGVFVGVQRMPVRLAAVEMNHLLCTSDRFMKEITATYLADIIIRSPLLIGSFDLIGNPTQIIAAVSRGVGDLVQIPSRAVGDGPVAFVFAVGEGISSLLKNVSEGTLMSVSGFSSSVARNLDGLSGVRMDQLSPPHQSQGLGSSLVHGISSLGQGVVGAVFGLVSAPVSGLVNGGLLGFAKGIGQGVTGIVARPIGGAFHFISHAARGLAEATAVYKQPPQIAEHSFDVVTRFLDEEFSYGLLPPLKLRLIAHLIDEVYVTQFYGSGLFLQDTLPFEIPEIVSTLTQICLLLTEKGIRVFIDDSIHADYKFEYLEFDAKTRSDLNQVILLHNKGAPKFLWFNTTANERRRFFSWLERMQRI
jgi:hypothetical protein